MKAKKLPSGSWRCQVYLGTDENGKKIIKSITKPTEAECLAEAGLLVSHRKAVKKSTSAMTLKEAIEAYINSRSNILSPSTIRGYDGIAKNHLQIEMDMPLAKIDDFVAQRAINREAETSSPKTVENIYGLLTAVMRTYADHVPKVALPQQEDFEPNILTKDQCRILIKAAADDELVEMPILMAMFLGLRRSEMVALTHDDYDRETQTVSITKATVMDRNQKFVQKTTKTRKSKRKIPVPDYLAHKMEYYIDNDIQFVHTHPNNIGKHLTRICKENHLPHMRLHDLRHQNASIMLALGTPDKYAMERGGWSSNTTMKKIYQHTLDDKRAEVTRNINAYFDDITPHEEE